MHKYAPKSDNPLVKLEFYSRAGENGCRNWIGSRSKDGYALVYWEKRLVLAHRLVWSVHNGSSIPAGMMVCHRCDNPLCVEPEHLFLGTHADNMADMKAKGRAASGITRGTYKPGPHPLKGVPDKARRKLNDEQVEEIRASKTNHRALARRYGVGMATIWRIQKGKKGYAAS